MFETEFAFAMKLRTFVLLTTTVFFLFGPENVFGANQDHLLVDAIKLYDQANYPQAEVLLKPLFEKNPDNALINYYYGACRTENHHYGTQEIELLLNGSSGEPPLKSAYYLALQYHAQNQFDKALQYYNQYDTVGSPDEKERISLSEKIIACEKRINPFQTPPDTIRDIAPLPRPRKLQQNDTISTITPVYPQHEMSDSIDTDSVRAESHIQPAKADSGLTILSNTEPIAFTVNGEMTYIDTSNFQTREGLLNYLSWARSQHSLDSLQLLVDSWREAYGNATTNTDRTQIGNKIIEAESQLFILQKNTNNYRTQALSAENNFWQQQSELKKSEFIESLNQQKAAVLPPISHATEKIDTSLILPAATTPALPNSKPVAQPTSTDELVYKIQIGAYSRGLPSYIKKLYDKLSYIRKIENYTDERGVVVYTTGRLNNYDDAVKMQNQVRREGIEDAFVVPYFNGKRITLEEAKKLEQKNDR